MRYNVYQWLGGTDMCEKVRHNADIMDAINAFRHYTNNVASRMGLTDRVMMTNSLDEVVIEWRAGIGIVQPDPKGGAGEEEK